LTSFVHQLMAAGTNPKDDPDAQRFIDALGETIAAYPGRVCIVGGVDLAHVGPQFGDQDPVTPDTLDWLAREDHAMLTAVEAGDLANAADQIAPIGSAAVCAGHRLVDALVRTP